MRKFLFTKFLAAVLLWHTAIAIAAPQFEPIALRHVSVVDVIHGGINEDVTVLLADGKIQAVGTNVAIGDARVVDAKGKFLIPGLWDMHVHCCNSDNHFFPLFLANGVTGIRDMFGPSIQDLKDARAEVEKGTRPGPRLIFSGPIVDGPKPVWPGSIAVANAGDGRKAVDQVQRDGADFVKVYSLLPRDAYFAIADEAKKRGIDFCGHVPDLVRAGEASAAGQKSFEHLLSMAAGCSAREQEVINAKGTPLMKRTRAVIDSYDPKKAEALFAQFRRNGTWQCPTLTVLRAMAHLDDPAFCQDPRLIYMPAEIEKYWNPKNDFRFKKKTAEDWEAMRLIFAEDCKIVGLLERAGVDIIAGTDSPNPYCFPGFGIHDELALLTGCGLTPLQALQTATINPARYFGWQNKMGSVEAGKAADLVLLYANPLKDIRNTTRIQAVFVRGQYFDRPALDKMLKGETRSASLRPQQLVGMDFDE